MRILKSTVVFLGVSAICLALAATATTQGGFLAGSLSAFRGESVEPSTALVTIALKIGVAASYVGAVATFTFLLWIFFRVFDRESPLSIFFKRHRSLRERSKRRHGQEGSKWEEANKPNPPNAPERSEPIKGDGVCRDKPVLDRE